MANHSKERTQAEAQLKKTQKAQRATEGSQAVCRQSISDSWLGNLRECLAHLV
jgi:hypothetical protein